MASTIVMILAGGKGSRLAPLTVHRAKPAVPFGGRYRIIDFVLSNLVNSGFRNIYVLTQFMASSLIRHLARNWHLSGMGQFIEVVPAQMRMGDRWYVGTADSVYQNLNLVRDSHADDVAIFGGDHIYKFSADAMEFLHRDMEADITVAAFPVPIDEAHQFGVIQVDTEGRIVGFQEKPKNPTPIPGRPGWCLVSMGNYFFKSRVLQEVLRADAADRESSHDFGKDVIPKMVRAGMRCYIYDFGQNTITGEEEGSEPYWRDVGTVESYFAANMDLRSRIPPLDVYNRRWPIRTAQRNFPPARFVRWGEKGRNNEVVDSLICEGTILCSATVRDVVAGYDCYFHADCSVEDSVILSGCDIGAGARLRRVMFDKNCSVAPGAVIGFDPEEDKKRFPFLSDTGIVLLPKGAHVPARGPIELPDDMVEILANDPSTAEWMVSKRDLYRVAGRDRYSHDSVGPRFRKFGPGAE